MKTYRIPVERIKKAQIRYYDSEHNGVEIPEFNAYTIFIKCEDTYINLFDCFGEFNVYERLPYSNTTQSGESFGSKIRLVSGKEEDGVCYVLETGNMEELDGCDDVSQAELYNIVLKSKDFYYDRIDLLEKYPNLVGYLERKSIIKSDMPKLEVLYEYLESIETEKINKKSLN